MSTPLSIGPLKVWPPVVLAPMAGITNYPFRSLCRQFGAGLYVSEMIGARALVDGHGKTRELASFGPDEVPRSIQLYGTDADSVGRAATWLVEEKWVDHIDLNFGCPAPKVTRHGGGAALPWKTSLFADIVSAAVRGAGTVPVTAKRCWPWKPPWQPCAKVSRAGFFHWSTGRKKSAEPLLPSMKR